MIGSEIMNKALYDICGYKLQQNQDFDFVVTLKTLFERYSKSNDRKTNLGFINYLIVKQYFILHHFDERETEKHYKSDNCDLDFKSNTLYVRCRQRISDSEIATVEIK